MSEWPSGLRRRTQVAVSQEAWVRTPSLTLRDNLGLRSQAIFFHLLVPYWKHRRSVSRHGANCRRACGDVAEGWCSSMPTCCPVLHSPPHQTTAIRLESQRLKCLPNRFRAFSLHRSITRNTSLGDRWGFTLPSIPGTVSRTCRKYIVKPVAGAAPPMAAANIADSVFSFILASRPSLVTLQVVSFVTFAIPLLPASFLSPLQTLMLRLTARGMVLAESSAVAGGGGRTESEDSLSSKLLADASGGSTGASLPSNPSNIEPAQIPAGSGDSTDRVSTSPVKKLSDWFLTATLPHSCFLHYYLLASAWTCVLLCLSLTASMFPAFELLLLLGLYQLHTLRRALETLLVARFSPSARMHAFIYLGGLM